MARKFGKKMEISLNPLDYNSAIIGESGIGKSTIVKEMCEKLVGEDGYISLDIGKEDGHRSIANIISESVPDWATFEEIIDDIIENKLTDYKDLKVVVIDTYDQLFELAEKETIRLHNRKNPEKPKIDTINSAFGGFGKGLDKTIELVLDKLWELKEVGVSFIIVGHVKKKDIEDISTGQMYSIMTSDMSQKYFNAIKTKLHFLGMASVDREIVQENTGKKNFKTGEEIQKGKVKSEARKITFRDDTFSIDSKSRFADIVDSIPFDVDELIKAMTDAILSEQAKTGISLDETKKRDAKAEKEKEKVAKEYIENKTTNHIDEERNVELISIIQTKFSDATDEIKEQVKEVMADGGIANFKSTDIPTQPLEKIVELLG